jgi:hypothetical protein
MNYFAGLDVSMEETDIWVLDREGTVIREGKTPTSPGEITDFLDADQTCARVVFETGRMACPVSCVQGRCSCGQERRSRSSCGTLRDFCSPRNDPGSRVGDR